MEFSRDHTKDDYIFHQQGRNNIRFQDIIDAIIEGNLLDDIVNDNPEYGIQKMFVVKVKDYTYKVPYKIIGNQYYLITAYPSRKLHVLYS